ncbi:zinc-binding alcohol dehydrogenase family protein [Aspergillus undulatus]|uniref:zinc-binding alcohol dehydrogenase family protein n=1 Tax=Aspergillus undulatus TaxID=1810928 RepID=UPI003CCCAE06
MATTKTHLAAILPAKGHPLTIKPRPTPSPGPGELLIAVKSIALNPADHIMRDTGLFIPPSAYPTVLGFDLAGVVVQVGKDVPTAYNTTPEAGREDKDEAAGPISIFHQGTGVAAYAAHVFKHCTPDYGAFQGMCLVPWEHAIPLPDGMGITWNEAATLPVSMQVPLSAWDAMGISRFRAETTAGQVAGEDKGGKDQALLIWGASSSVGSMGVQSARLLSQSSNSTFCAVYATASAANHAYIRALGADRVFDYRGRNVVEEIVQAAKEDGLVIRCCFLAVGDVAMCQGVLKAFLPVASQDNEWKAKGTIASAPPIPDTLEEVDGVKTTFLNPSTDEKERLAQFQYWMGNWGRRNLVKGAIRPSLEVRVVGRGLGATNAGLDLLRKGVSCTKLVVEVAE